MVSFRDKSLGMSDTILANRDTIVSRLRIPEEMRAIVRAGAEPWMPGDSVKMAQQRAARTLGLSLRRVRTLWEGAPCALLATEADRLRSWYRDHLARAAERCEAQARAYRAAAVDMEVRQDAVAQVLERCGALMGGDAVAAHGEPGSAAGPVGRAEGGRR